MKFIFAFVLALSFTTPALASSHKSSGKKHHATRSAKRKSRKRKHAQTAQALPGKSHAPAATRATASATGTSRVGALYVSKYFQKSVYLSHTDK